MKTKSVENTQEEFYQNPLAWWGKTQEKSQILSKWMALYEAVNVIADKAEEKGIPLEDVEFKPLDIRDYISSTEDIYLRKILQEDYRINICHNEDASDEFKDMFPEIQVKMDY